MAETPETQASSFWTRGAPAPDGAARLWIALAGGLAMALAGALAGAAAGRTIGFDELVSPDLSGPRLRVSPSAAVPRPSDTTAP